MAEKRMFAKIVIDSDKFLDMPISSQALYFHLGMRADDEGFVNSPKRILRLLGCSDDDLSVLKLKGFIIPFDSGVVVITDWHVSNTLRGDRRKPTICESERSMLMMDKSKRYYLNVGQLTDNCPQNVSRLTDTCPPIDVQTADICPHSIVENRINKYSLGESECSTGTHAQEHNNSFGEYKHVLLSEADYYMLKERFGESLIKEYIDRLDLYCETHNKTYNNYCAVLINWILQDKPKAGFDNDSTSDFNADKWYEQAESYDPESIIRGGGDYS